MGNSPHRPDDSWFEDELDRILSKDDDSEARAILASGEPIAIARDDTPEGYFIRLYPDGREELSRVDFEAAARILGS